jgi:hypothetical protein
VPRRSYPSIARGRWALPVAALFVGVWGGVGVAPVAAQKVAPTAPPPMSPKPQPPTGTGGGAGLAPSIPDFTPAPAIVAPSPAAPTTVVPAAPAPIIRFRCAVAPAESTCKEQPPGDAGGSDETCDCARDFCYQDGAGARICEKAAN